MNFRFRRPLAVLLALLSIWTAIPTPPAQASIPFQLYTGAVTASGQGAAKQIYTNVAGWVTVDVTAVSGTYVFDCWLEGSNDEGVTWEEIAHAGAMKTSGAAAANSLSAAGRDIVDNKTTGGAERFSAMFPTLPMRWIRIAWTLSGSTPSVTFTARFGGK